MDLIQRFWAQYAKIKAGDWPDTSAEFAVILRLLADAIEAWGPGEVSTQASVSVEEAEAEVKKMVDGAVTAQIAGNPFLRRLLELALAKLAEELLRRFAPKA